MVNAQNQAVGAILLPTSENMRCERNTQSYWRAITGIQVHRACLLLRSQFPTGSNKKQIFVSETPLVFNYSHLYLLLTFFWDETLYLTVYPSSEHSYDRLAEPRIFQEINLSPAFLLFSTLFFKKRYLQRNKWIPCFPKYHCHHDPKKACMNTYWWLKLEKLHCYIKQKKIDREWQNRRSVEASLL